MLFHLFILISSRAFRLYRLRLDFRSVQILIQVNVCEMGNYKLMKNLTSKLKGYKIVRILFKRPIMLKNEYLSFLLFYFGFFCNFLCLFVSLNRLEQIIVIEVIVKFMFGSANKTHFPFLILSEQCLTSFWGFFVYSAFFWLHLVNCLINYVFTSSILYLSISK